MASSSSVSSTALFDGSLSLGEILHIYGGPLDELQLWSLCFHIADELIHRRKLHRNGVSDGDDVRENDKSIELPTVITPDTVLLCSGGIIDFLSVLPNKLHFDSQAFLPEEVPVNSSDTNEYYNHQMGATLWACADFSLSDDEIPAISDLLEQTITSLTDDEPTERLSLEDAAIKAVNHSLIVRRNRQQRRMTVSQDVESIAGTSPTSTIPRRRSCGHGNSAMFNSSSINATSSSVSLFKVRGQSNSDMYESSYEEGTELIRAKRLFRHICRDMYREVAGMRHAETAVVAGGGDDSDSEDGERGEDFEQLLSEIRLRPVLRSLTDRALQPMEALPQSLHDNLMKEIKKIPRRRHFDESKISHLTVFDFSGADIAILPRDRSKAEITLNELYRNIENKDLELKALREVQSSLADRCVFAEERYFHTLCLTVKMGLLAQAPNTPHTNLHRLNPWSLYEQLNYLQVPPQQWPSWVYNQLVHCDRVESSTITSQQHWVKDGDVTNCKACTGEFSLMKRRHHCRSCGFVFCSGCCNRSIVLMTTTASSSSSSSSSLSSRFKSKKKPVRVCEACHATVSLERLLTQRK